eukprot:8957833-Alexandrium_andersonii.AAC.1
MSASLVGSEMCIRDRGKRAAAAAAASLVSCFGGSVRRIFRHGGGVSLSVSYTHLTLPTICSV